MVVEWNVYVTLNDLGDGREWIESGRGLFQGKISAFVSRDIIFLQWKVELKTDVTKFRVTISTNFRILTS
jgi:hypothetical protein